MKANRPKGAKRVRTTDHQKSRAPIRAAHTAARSRHVSPAKLRGGAREGSKLAMVISMLRNSGGASIDALSKVTGWQAHSVRGALAGALRKKLGLKVVSEKADGIRIYRIES